MKNKKSVRVWIVCLSLIIVLGIFGGCAYMFGKHYVNIKGQQLNKYEFHSGGGMLGGYYREVIERYNDEYALICIERAQWHYQDPTVEEYLVDISILKDMEDIIRKNRMNFWNKKKFTNEFVYDGETDGYSFSFDKNSISFSSQIYPLKYGVKLKKFNEVIDRYMVNATRLPGLVNPRVNDDENYNLPENGVEVYVYTVSNKYLGIKILNGTEEEIRLLGNYKLVDLSNNEVILERENTGSITVAAKTRDDTGFYLEERLQAGNYKLIYDSEEILFEIR